MGRNRIVQHYLRQWGNLDTNLEYLNSVESINIKILYTSLKELTPEERKFLADKYRMNGRPVTDGVAASQNGMPLKGYRGKRDTIETKLKPIILEAKNQYQDDFSKALHLVYGK